MKDLPHHMKKLNRNVLRSIHRQETEEAKYEAVPSPQHPSKQAERTHKKQEMKKERESHIPSHLSEEERNRQMRYRVPQFDRNNAKPKHAKAGRKKTPPL